MSILKAIGFKMDEYQSKIKASLSEWDARVERSLAEKDRQAANKELSQGDDYREYQDRRAKIERLLADFRDASEDKWEDLKTEVEKAWLDVKNAFQKLANRFDD